MTVLVIVPQGGVRGGVHLSPKKEILDSPEMNPIGLRFTGNESDWLKNYHKRQVVMAVQVT